MEILGRSIPTLQSAIASGLESVKAGIAESAKAVGVAALGIAQDSFSFEQTAIASSVDLPAVSGAGEYPGPNQYFGKFPNVASDSPISSFEISKTLADPNFDVPKALHTFREGSATIVDDVMRRIDFQNKMNDLSPGSYHDDDYMNPVNRIGDIFSSDVERKPTGPTLGDVTYDAVNRNERDKSDAASFAAGGYPATDRFGRETFEGRNVPQKPLPGNLTPGQYLGEIHDTPRGEVGAEIYGGLLDNRLELPKMDGYPATDRFGQEKSDVASFAAGGDLATERNGNERFDGRYAQDDKMNKEVHRKQEQLRQQQEQKEQALMEKVAPSAEERYGREKAEGPTSDGVSYRAADRFGSEKTEGTVVGKNIQPGEALMDKPAPSAERPRPGDALMWKPTPGEALMWKPTPSPALGLSDGASNRSIIVVGGKTDTPASDRSIIVVGGKTSSTYFKTIDDSLSQLQQNPTPETSNLFTQQFSVVKDMVSTVSKTVSFQQTLDSSRFTSLR